MVAWNCRPEPFKISVFNLLTPVDSCLELSTRVDRWSSVYGLWRLADGFKNEVFWGGRKAVDFVSIGC